MRFWIRSGLKPKHAITLEALSLTARCLVELAQERPICSRTDWLLRILKLQLQLTWPFPRLIWRISSFSLTTLCSARDSWCQMLTDLSLVLIVSGYTKPAKLKESINLDSTRLTNWLQAQSQRWLAGSDQSKATIFLGRLTLTSSLTRRCSFSVLPTSRLRILANHPLSPPHYTSIPFA